MSKKVFTLLLLAVFMLAQFSMASAATVAGDVTVDALPTFHTDSSIAIDFEVVNMNAGTKWIYVWARLADSPNNLWATANCQQYGSTTLAADSGTHLYSNNFYTDQETVEFYVTVDATNNAGCAGAVSAPATAEAAMTSTTIDGDGLYVFVANPPNLVPGIFGTDRVSCNTFEMWGLAADILPFDTQGYSGFDSWNEGEFGAFAPAPEGSENDLLSWVKTIPASASGNWWFFVEPSDVAGNDILYWFRLPGGPVVSGTEKAECEDFTDTAGHADEVYIRYLADLGIGAGNPDGSYGPDTTLTRAEASVLFETANGYDAASLPTAAPSAACTFTDVLDTDWFAGWVWQACDDGFMNGLGGGLFGSADTLTRGQIVTVFNNMVDNGLGNDDTYLDDGTNFDTVLNTLWGGGSLRWGAWSDVSAGAYYFFPVLYAYGIGVAEGTSATTFSPDQAVLRGEFAKMLYRALSREFD